MADYTPTLGDYTELKPFRFWCQKVLPLVYDDSLSYYELLCKVVDYLNKTMEDVDTMHDDVVNLHVAYVQLQTYVNTYFDNLDVQEEINNKLDDMAEDGSLSALISPFIPDIVTSWLTDHVVPTSPVVDNTLSISGAAADSKVTGDKFKISLMANDRVTGENVDFNNLPLGWCRIYGLTSPAHAPVSDPFGFVVTYRDITTGDTPYRTQIYYGYRTGESYIRFSASATTFGDWYKLSSAQHADAAYDSMIPYQGNLSGSEVDFNNLTGGFYRVYSTTNPQHAPKTNLSGFVICYEDGTASGSPLYTQMYFDYSKDIYIRYSTSNGWTSWERITRSNFEYKENLSGSGIDFNNVAGGWYRVYSTTSPSNSPVTDPFGFLACFIDNENYSSPLRTQIFFSYRTNETYIRFSSYGGWDPWQSIYPPDFYFKNILSGSGINLNNLDFGWYRIYSTTNPQNSPVENPFGFIMCFTDNANKQSLIKTQIYYGYRSHDCYIRFAVTDGTWEPWHSLNKTEYDYTVTINSGDNLYTAIKAISANTHVIINPGTYDISTDLESSGDTDYTGDIHIKSGCWIEGRGNPLIVATLNNKKSNRSVFFMDSGDCKISGVNMSVTNARYAIHDDNSNNDTAYIFTHVIEDCSIDYTGLSGEATTDGRCIGGGMGSNVTNIVKGCIFKDTNTYPVDYHTNSGAVSSQTITGKSKLVIKDNYFITGSARCRALSDDTDEHRDTAIINNNRGKAAFSVFNPNDTVDAYVWNNIVE